MLLAAELRGINCNYNDVTINLGAELRGMLRLKSQPLALGGGQRPVVSVSRAVRTMAGGFFGPIKTRRQIEQEFLDVVRQRQAEWLGATPEASSATQQRFLKTLQAFTALVIDGKL